MTLSTPQQIAEAERMVRECAEYSGLQRFPYSVSDNARKVYVEQTTKIILDKIPLPQLIAARDECERLRQRLTLQVSIARDTILAADNLRAERDELKISKELLRGQLGLLAGGDDADVVSIKLERDALQIAQQQLTENAAKDRLAISTLRTREAALMEVARAAQKVIWAIQPCETQFQFDLANALSNLAKAGVELK